MDALDRVQEHLEQIARSNAEAAAWRAESDQWRAESDQWRAKYEQWRVGSEARAEARHAKAEESKRSLEKQIEKTDKQIKETEKQVKETSRVAREIFGKWRDVGQTQDSLIEEFYYQAFCKAPRLGDVKFGGVRANIEATHRNGKSAKYDLLLLNDEMVAVIEIEIKLRREDVERMRDVTLPNFRRFLWEHNNKTLVPAVAGMTADQDAVALAHECGYAVLLPDGQKVRADIGHLRYIPS